MRASSAAVGLALTTNSWSAEKASVVLKLAEAILSVWFVRLVGLGVLVASGAGWWC